MARKPEMIEEGESKEGCTGEDKNMKKKYQKRPREEELFTSIKFGIENTVPK